MTCRVAGAVELQHDVTDKLLEKKVRKRFESITAKQRLKRMLGKKAEISPPELQRQVSKDIRDAARKK